MRLLWREDAAQKGIVLGREGVWTKSKRPKPKSKLQEAFQPVDLKPYAYKWIFLNTTFNDFGKISQDGDHPMSVEGADTEDELFDEPTEILRTTSLDSVSERSQKLILGRSPSRPASQNYTSIEGNLFDYFVGVIGPNCSLSSSQNPYLELLAPIAVTFPPLNSALLAVSANQLRLLNDTRFEREALSHKHKAIQGVQSAIDVGNADARVVATILMLCFYDISDGCNPSWVTHLRGGLSLLESLSNYTGTHTASEKMLLTFLRMYFVAHAIMSRTANEEDFAFSDDPSCSWPDSEDMEEVDVLMGCSRELMAIIRKIPSLAAKAARIQESSAPADTLIQLSTERDVIERSLLSLQQTIPSTVNDPEQLTIIAESKRLTALLYLRSRLPGLTFPHSNTIMSSAFKTNLIATIIEHLEKLPNTSTLLWPLFVLGSMRELNEEQRRFVHERLMALQRLRNLGSIKRARLSVEEMWRRLDMKTDETEIIGTKWFNDSAISLA
ncbi:C6 zinc finger domain-containing protein [Phlyctema vagabunda]|uniref:C6 zinc finger domain-containing protein n=1 Tax=Phlyctema vagabunda TaxID=108571 RepID=A0ABR4PLR6_9HELO